MSNPFSDAAMAAGYATARPLVHPSVIALLATWRRGVRVGIAGDIGCGAGLSTRALLDVADRCVGFDPSESMIRAAHHVSPGALFVVASAEAMPLASRTVDLLTAAGSLNYVRDLDAAWTEARRVLTRRGTLAVYDARPAHTRKWRALLRRRARPSAAPAPDGRRHQPRPR